METHETDNNPLVSIIVITYNSAKYVLETLESAKAQTYQNIELIVSDDGSTDNTVEICRKWIEENKERFVRTELITVPSNTGIPANCNRGFRASHGEWVKLIAGDDILTENFCERIVYYSNLNPKIALYHTKVEVYKNTFMSENKIDYIDFSDHIFNTNKVNSDLQYQILLRFCPIFAPSTAIKRMVLLEVGGFDEKYTLLEDYPLWIKLTKLKYTFFYINEPLVKYRIHSNSVQRSEKIPLFSRQNLQLNDFIRNEVAVNLPILEKYFFYFKRNLILFFIKLGLSKNNFLSKAFIWGLINPLQRINKKIQPKFDK
jgi:alpha-1,3-rhamnosyltransferase